MSEYRHAELLRMVHRARGRVVLAAGLDPRGRELAATAAAALADLAEHLEARREGEDRER